MKTKFIFLSLCLCIFVITLALRFQYSKETESSYSHHLSFGHKNKIKPKVIQVLKNDHKVKIQQEEFKRVEKKSLLKNQLPIGQNRILEKSIKEKVAASNNEAFKKSIRETQIKVYEAIIGNRMLKELNLPKDDLKDFYQIKRNYRDLDLDKEFGLFILDKYGQKDLVDTNQEWENFQQHIYQKYQRSIIKKIGEDNYHFYQSYMEPFREESYETLIDYPHLLEL